MRETNISRFEALQISIRLQIKNAKNQPQAIFLCLMRDKGASDQRDNLLWRCCQ